MVIRPNASQRPVGADEAQGRPHGERIARVAVAGGVAPVGRKGERDGARRGGRQRERASRAASGPASAASAATSAGAPSRPGRR